MSTERLTCGQVAALVLLCAAEGRPPSLGEVGLAIDVLEDGADEGVLVLIGPLSVPMPDAPPGRLYPLGVREV